MRQAPSPPGNSCFKTNPNLDKKPIVERMIAEAQGKSS